MSNYKCEHPDFPEWDDEGYLEFKKEALEIEKGVHFKRFLLLSSLLSLLLVSNAMAVFYDNSHGISMSTGSRSDTIGMAFTMNVNCTNPVLKNVTLYTGNTALYGSLRTAASPDSILQYANVTSRVANFSYSLTGGTKYIVLFGSGGATYTGTNEGGSSVNNQASAVLNWTGCYYSGAVQAVPCVANQVQTIQIQCDGGGSPTDTLTFNSPTPINNSKSYRLNPQVNISSSIQNFQNVTIGIYSGSTLVDSSFNTSPNYTATFNTLANGTYTINVTAYNSSGGLLSAKRSFNQSRSSYPVPSIEWSFDGNMNSTRGLNFTCDLHEGVSGMTYKNVAPFGTQSIMFNGSSWLGGSTCDTTGWPTGDMNITAMFWELRYNPSSPPVSQKMLRFGTETVAGGIYTMNYYDYTGVDKLHHGSRSDAVVYTYNYSTAQWVFHTGRYTTGSKNTEVFVNGSLMAASAQANPTALTYGGQIVTMGQDNSAVDGATCASTNTCMLNGTLFKGMRIYLGTYLTDDQIATMYADGLDGHGYLDTSSQALSFVSPTPANGTQQYRGNNTFNASTQALGFGGTVTINQTLFNSSGSLVQSYQSTGTSLNRQFTFPNFGTYILNATATNGTITLTSENRTLLYTMSLRVSIYDARNNTVINSFNVTLIDQNNTAIYTANTTNGSIYFNSIQGSEITITYDAPGYAIDTYNYTLINNATQFINQSIPRNNSVTINIYDETTGANIYENITIVLTGLTETTYSTTNGSIYLEGLAVDNYTVKLSGANYTLNQYSLTVSDRSFQTLNAYLSASTSTSTFTIMDYDSAAVLPGATFTQARLINGSWTTVNSKTSDITGRVQITYLPNVKYQFTVTLTGYNSQVFYLDPVLFSTYDVRLTKTTILTQPTTPDYLGVSITFYNKTFYNNANNTLVWMISSPIGSLERYNRTLQWPGGSDFDSGTSAIGGFFNTTFQITNANLTHRVNLTYCYKSTTSYDKCFSYQYAIIGAYSNSSFIANQDQTYGLGLLERVLIVTILTLMVAGLAFYYGGALPGLVIALFIMWYFVSIGFISQWLVWPGTIVGFFLVLWGMKNG